MLHAARKVLQEQREPEDQVQPRDGPGRAVRGQAHRPGSGQPGHRDLARRSPRPLRRRGRGRHGDRVPQADRRPRAHRRADGQAGDLPEGPRGRARDDLRRVQPARRRDAQRDGEAVRAGRHHPGDPGPRRGGADPQGAVPRRELQHRRSPAGRHPRRVAQRQGAADPPVAHRSRAADQAVRAGSARDLRRHRHDPRRRARSRAIAPRSRSSRASATSTRSAPASA